MTETIETSPKKSIIKKIIFKQNFWATLISLTSIIVAFVMLWSVTIPNSTPLALVFLFFIPVPVIMSMSLNFLRDDEQFIWIQPILVLFFCVGFVWFFFSETNENNYLKYPEYKQVILSDPDLKDFNERKVKPDFDEIEKDSMIMRYEMVQILDAMEIIRTKQIIMQNELKERENENRIKLIKENFGK